MQARTTTPFATVFEHDWLLLCSTARLRRHHALRHAALQSRAGQRVWRAPRIDSLDAWLASARDQLIDDGLETATLLSAAQELCLWEQVIADDLGPQALLQTRAAAAAAARASATMSGWQLSERQIASAGSAETAIFCRWRGRVQQLCAANGWRQRADLIAVVTDAVTSGTLRAPPTMVLAGLQHPPPAVGALLTAMAAAGTRLMDLDAPHPPTTATLIAAPDPDAELDAVTRWCVSALAADPGARLGVATPALRDHGPALTRRLTRSLHPETLWPGVASDTCHVHAALGQPLAATPVIDTALLILDLSTRAVDLDSCGALLRSPFTPGAAQELAARAGVDARLRRDAVRQVSLQALTMAARASESAAVPVLVGALERLAEMAGRQAPVQPLEAWARYFGRALRHFGWPGDPPSEPLAHAAHQRLADLLPGLAHLGALVRPCTAQVAVARLRELATDILIERPDGEAARVQIVSIEDAALMAFDGLWVMGLDDTAWPPPPQPTPFLPGTVLRACGVPGASAAQTLDDASRLTAQLRRAAGVQYVSHTLADGDQERRASALLAGWALTPPTGSATPPAPPDDWTALVGSAVLQACHDSHGAPLPGVASAAVPSASAPGGVPAAAPTTAPGGTALLADQSDCPFRAYLKHRLGVEPLEEPAAGIDPRLTGTLVHQALDYAWGKLRNGHALQALTQASLESLAVQSVRAAVRKARGPEAKVLGTRLGAVEIARIERLVSSWLGHEQRREAPFEVVEREQRSVVAIGPLHLDIRADRVDRLEDGSLVIIDYKTGQDLKANGWDRARMAEPQVPLYAVTREEPVAAVALASLRAERVRFLGQARDADILPGVGDGKQDPELPWATRLAGWRSALEALAAEAAEGLATVTPAPDACRYCAFPAVCRVGTAFAAEPDPQAAASPADGASA